MLERGVQVDRSTMKRWVYLYVAHCVLKQRVLQAA